MPETDINDREYLSEKQEELAWDESVGTGTPETAPEEKPKQTLLEKLLRK